ncbi:MAG: hypothetical protein HY752_01190 [Nitrospirae bacterium]|nr:hypothetical protein [Nitrospirota bacterium]
MADKDYVVRLGNVIKQMLTPLKDIPFNLVIESLSGCKVIPFDLSVPYDKELLEKLKLVAVESAKRISTNGIESDRPNEVGNYIEPFVKNTMNEQGLEPATPTGKEKKKKSMGYPDIIFQFKGEYQYLECKTYNIKNIDSTQRSFFFSPSEDFKVIHDAHHFILSLEIFIDGGKGIKNIYRCRHWKILSIENLLVDVKHEFNSNNKRIYSGEGGATLLAEGNI